MKHTRIVSTRFASFRQGVRLAMSLAIIGIVLGARASALEFLYVSMYDNSTNENTIVRYDISIGSSAAVEASASVFVPSGQGLDNPHGLAFDTSGNLYVASNGDNTISKYDSAGVLQFSWSTGSAAPAFLAVGCARTFHVRSGRPGDGPDGRDRPAAASSLTARTDCISYEVPIDAAACKTPLLFEGCVPAGQGGCLASK